MAKSANRKARRTSLDRVLGGTARTRRRRAPAQPAEPLTIEQAQQIIHVQKQQVEHARKAFYKLAEWRGSDMVKHENKSLEEAAQYRDGEMQALDNALHSLVPPELQQPAAEPTT